MTQSGFEFQLLRSLEPLREMYQLDEEQLVKARRWERYRKYEVDSNGRWPMVQQGPEGQACL